MSLAVVSLPMQKEKMHDFERQVEQLSEQVTLLMREKATLETRNSLLERVVQLKDEQHQSDGYEVSARHNHWQTKAMLLHRMVDKSFLTWQHSCIAYSLTISKRFFQR